MDVVLSVFPSLQFVMLSLSAEAVAKLCLHEPKHFAVQLHQTEHRIALLSQWDVKWFGTKVLELGCGQGDCTAVLAEAIGPQGHITAVDPAPLTYGSPYTLGEAQAHLSKGRLGERITWVRANPLEFLHTDTADAQYDVVVLAHCFWYFSSPEVIAETLRLLSTRAKKVCVAEWSLSTAPAHPAYAHVLAVLTQAALECRKVADKSRSNVRTIVSPARIKELATTSGLQVEKEGVVTPGPKVYDGQWEVAVVVGDNFVKEVQRNVQDERERSVVFALRDATIASVESLEGKVKDVRAMDAWCGVLSPAAS